MKNSSITAETIRKIKRPTNLDKILNAVEAAHLKNENSLDLFGWTISEFGGYHYKRFTYTDADLSELKRRGFKIEELQEKHSWRKYLLFGKKSTYVSKYHTIKW